MTQVVAGPPASPYDTIMLELDVRVLPPPKKHVTIHEQLKKLQPGEALRITNDHDPRPLRFELDHDYPNRYSFDYLESGPETWLVDIIRSSEKAPDPRFELLAESNGISVSRVSFETGASLPSHQIGDNVAVIVSEGSILLETRGDRHKVSAGSVELLPPNSPHALESLERSVAYVVRVKGTSA